MQGGQSGERLGGGVVVAFALLIGVVLLGHGWVSHNRPSFWAGLVVTLGGVLTGVLHLIRRRRVPRGRPNSPAWFIRACSVCTYPLWRGRRRTSRLTEGALA